ARPAGVGVDDEGDPHPAAEVARQGLLDGGAGPVAGLEVPLVGHGEAGDAVGGVDPAAAPPLAADLHREALEHAAGPGRLDLVAGGRGDVVAGAGVGGGRRAGPRGRRVGGRGGARRRRAGRATPAGRVGGGAGGRGGRGRGAAP